MDYNPGDLVRVRSGGPVLTVVKTDAADVSVVWFCDLTGEFRSQSLAAVVLEPVDLLDETEDDISELDEDDLDEVFEIEEDEEEEEAPEAKGGKSSRRKG